MKKPSPLDYGATIRKYEYDGQPREAVTFGTCTRDDMNSYVLAMNNYNNWRADTAIAALEIIKFSDSKAVACLAAETLKQLKDSEQ